jgi:hypothetical protein
LIITVIRQASTTARFLNTLQAKVPFPVDEYRSMGVAKVGQLKTLEKENRKPKNNRTLEIIIV